MMSASFLETLPERRRLLPGLDGRWPGLPSAEPARLHALWAQSLGLVFRSRLAEVHVKALLQEGRMRGKL